jgi:alcohol dehydrogenase (NADP+)
MSDYSGPFEVKCYNAVSPTEPLVPGKLVRRGLGPQDIVISIKYAGICHSDIHKVRNECTLLYILTEAI